MESYGDSGSNAKDASVHPSRSSGTGWPPAGETTGNILDIYCT